MCRKEANHHYLHSKLTDLWKLQKSVILIDLRENFYMVKLIHEESHKKILLEGSWFVAGSYVSIRVWEPNFVPAKSKIAFTAIWVRLHSLPIEFYDKTILEKIGRRIGCLLKIDACTTSSLKGRYARICVQIQNGETSAYIHKNWAS